ncbi:MAG TPA: hypothetical protein VGN72_14890 [Tepidisphaeraceae bacterium]|jgi:hypothetical protein|nr:hypothetical protein [Tepidisphaeraceae bacterium]
MKKKIPLVRLALLASIGAFGAGRSANAAEFGASTPYYEDDGWLDITEWFDGNDYNPTDEAWWRWDDEQYSAAKDTAGDSDSDSWYGYDTADDNDNWYYDRYDSGAYNSYANDEDGVYTYDSRYYDYDNDGAYDAYVTYADWNADGVYDDYNYYSFGSAGTQQQQQHAQSEAARESRAQAISGPIQKMKLVQVRDGQNVVVTIQHQDKPMIVDLGRADAIKDLNLKLGNEITVRGPKAQVGKQSIVLARSLEAQGQTKQINRQGRQLEGKVLSTHKAKIRGTQHLIAMVDAQRQGNDKRSKVAVDLGPADKLKMDISKDASITFTAVPVKVQDKRLLFAQSVTMNGNTAQIDRRGRQGNNAQPAAGSMQPQQGQNAQQGQNQNAQQPQNQQQN